MKGASVGLNKLGWDILTKDLEDNIALDLRNKEAQDTASKLIEKARKDGVRIRKIVPKRSTAERTEQGNKDLTERRKSHCSGRGT